MGITETVRLTLLKLFLKGIRMIIHFKTQGYIAQWFQEEDCFVTLPQPSTLAHFFAAIDEKFGDRLPQSIWNAEKKRFRGPVIVSIDNTTVKDENFILLETQMVCISRFLIGG